MSDLFFRFNVAVITLKNPFIISKGKNSPTRYVNPICLPLRDNGPVSDRLLDHRPSIIDDRICCKPAPNSIVY